MEPQLGLLYRFPTLEVDDEWTYERNGRGRVVNRFHAVTHDEAYAIFVGTHGEYNLFAFHRVSQYNNDNITYEIFYIKKDEEGVEEMEHAPDMPYEDYLIWFVGSPAFPHPAAISQDQTTSIRVTAEEIEAAWRQHLQDKAIAHGKNLSAKKIATWMTAAPPVGSFSGGPIYKRAAASYANKAGGQRKKSRARTTNKKSRARATRKKRST